MLAFLAIAYGLFLQRLNGLAAATTLGLVFGLGAVLSMLDPIEIQPGVFADSRTTMVVLASFFGGPVAATISTLIAVACRILLGGVGTLAGTLAIILSMVIGLTGYYWVGRRIDQVRYWHVACLAGMTAFTTASLLVLPIPFALDILEHTGLPVVAVRVLGVIFLGAVMLEQQRRILAETRVRELAYVDELSGLANRRAFSLQLSREWNRWERYGENFTIVLVDIDTFKSINDQFGHPVGDIVIQRLAEIMLAESRHSDIVARTGGEEFGLLLPYTSSETGGRVAERIRKRVAETTILAEGREVRFTVSLGVSASADRYRSMSKCLSGADRALYGAKKRGRNMVIVDTPSQALANV
ncbi:GGDEF domain-containing protein [Amorphus sp. 3PC139-8]|uniref:GGDEF domain-containing protein n=1 Tax=Amorphus sp. 3PC139-8 TaxID=2735676 RepID=UPI00345CA7D7